MSEQLLQIENILKKLTSAGTKITSSLLVTSEGLPMAGAIPGEYEQESLGAMAALMLSMSDEVAEELLKSKSELSIVMNNKGYVVSSRINDDLSLLVTAKPEAKLGLLIYFLKKASKEIKEALETKSLTLT